MKRFWDKTVPALDGCWHWSGGRATTGYGRFKLNGRYQGAHRVAYTLAHGDPGALFVCHRCDNPLCVNPRHLFLGTSAENNRDMVLKGRNARKITAEDAKAIRERFSAGEDLTDLAREYGISVPTASNIKTGKKWAHAGGPVTPAGRRGPRANNPAGAAA